MRQAHVLAAYWAFTAVAVHLGLGARLTMQVSLDWWNFEESVLGFFLHCAAVAEMLISVSYWTARLLRGAHPGSGAAVAQRFDQHGQGR